MKISPSDIMASIILHIISIATIAYFSFHSEECERKIMMTEEKNAVSEQIIEQCLPYINSSTNIINSFYNMNPDYFMDVIMETADYAAYVESGDSIEQLLLKYNVLNGKYIDKTDTIPKAVP